MLSSGPLSSSLPSLSQTVALLCSQGFTGMQCLSGFLNRGIVGCKAGLYLNSALFADARPSQ